MVIETGNGAEHVVERCDSCISFLKLMIIETEGEQARFVLAAVTSASNS
jgi:hypothetical protein